MPRRTGTQCTSVRPQTARSCAARASQRRPMASQARCRSGRLRRAACRPQPLTLRLSAVPPQRRLHSGLCGAGAGLGPPRRGWRLAAGGCQGWPGGASWALGPAAGAGNTLWHVGRWRGGRFSGVLNPRRGAATWAPRAASAVPLSIWSFQRSSQVSILAVLGPVTLACRPRTTWLKFVLCPAAAGLGPRCRRRAVARGATRRW